MEQKESTMKKENLPLTYKENKSYKKQKIVIYAKKDLVLMMAVKNIINSEITVIILELLIIFVI